MEQSDILRNLRIEQLTPMQEAARDAYQSDKDLVLLSPTGSGKTLAFLLPLVHFLFLCAVDEYCGQGLFVFPADEYGRHGERFVRGHPQSFEVYGQVYVEASVRKGELLSGDEHFSPVEFLCTS